MMKMRTKRDQRPLLTQEAPILSDQMDPSGESEEEQRNETTKQTMQPQQQQHQQQTKRPWRRLFGKGGGKNKRKENHNPQSIEETNSLPSFSQSYSDDAADDDNDIYQDLEQQPDRQQDHRQRSSSFAESSKQRSQSEDGPQSLQEQQQSADKRDDATESSQSNHIKELLETEPPTPTEYKAKKSSLKISTQDRPSASANATPKSATTQPHRNHVSPGHHATVSPNFGTTNQNTYSRRVNRSGVSSPTNSRSKVNSPTSITSRILSRPFGREHILTTEQTVRLIQNLTVAVHVCSSVFRFSNIFFWGGSVGCSCSTS
jgi:hypothetical protein